MSAAAPGAFSMALVRVNELRAQKSLATRHFDDMDDWMEDQEGLGLQQTLAMLESDETSNYAIVWNAYPGLKSSSSSPLARVSPTYGALCSVAGMHAASPSTDCDDRSSGMFSSSSSACTKISKLWGKCKRKLRKLASKHSSTQQSSPRSSSTSSSSGALTSSSAPSSRRSSSTSSGSSFLRRSSSSSSSGFSSSPASSVALDYPSPLHSVLSSSPGACLVPTPEALAQQAQHWQHALSAMAGLSRWWTG